MRAGSGQDEMELKLEKIERWSKRRKEMIQKILIDKRRPHAHQNEQKLITESFSQKKPEDINLIKSNDIGMEEEYPEETTKRPYARVDQYYRYPTKRNRRRCWYCYSTSHYKQNCPHIRCFHCNKLGHVKKNCWVRKVDFLLSTLVKNTQVKENKKEKKKEKKKQRKKELKIINYRAANTNIKMKNIEKGDKVFIYWKEKEIGEYLGNGLPQMVLDKFRSHQFKMNMIYVRIKRDTPLKSFTVYDGFSQWCSCGSIDMDKEYFISHVKRLHQGVIPKDSQLNRPFWFDWVRYKTDGLEEIFCTTLSDLSDMVL